MRSVCRACLEEGFSIDHVRSSERQNDLRSLRERIRLSESRSTIGKECQRFRKSGTATKASSAISPNRYSRDKTHLLEAHGVVQDRLNVETDGIELRLVATSDRELEGLLGVGEILCYELALGEHPVVRRRLVSARTGKSLEQRGRASAHREPGRAADHNIKLCGSLSHVYW